jgi:hypothetical protein
VRGESRLITGALRAGGVAVVPATAVGFLVRGTEGALAVVVALGIVVGNLVLFGLIMMFAARVFPDAAPAFAIPSYAFRMIGGFTAMAAVRSTTAIDPTTFFVAFAAGLVGILAYECFIWARTPWLALDFVKERP